MGSAAHGLIEDLLRQPLISERQLAERGIEVKSTDYAALGGGLGTFAFVDTLRNFGVAIEQIVVVSNDDSPYGHFRRLVENSQIPEHERLRSNSDACPGNLWGFPGYAPREILRALSRGNLQLGAYLAWQLFGEPNLVPTFTPRAVDVWREMDREAGRIGYQRMLLRGTIAAIRKTHEGRIVALVESVDSPSTSWRAVSATYVHLSPGYPAINVLPEVAAFRRANGDALQVVNAYEDHDHVYEGLRQDGGTVLLRGRGIVASRVIERLRQQRCHKPVSIIHLHRRGVVEGARFGHSRRKVEENFEFQPFNWPKATWGGQFRRRLEKLSPEQRQAVLGVWGGVTTADRPEWKRMIREGLREGWYRSEFGVVDHVKPGPGGTLAVTVRVDDRPETRLRLVDYLLDCTGLVARPNHSPLLRDLVEMFGLPLNPSGHLAVSNEFEVEGMRNGESRLYASGIATLGGHFAGVDSFLGLQYAALRAVRHMHSIGAPGIRNFWFNPLYSARQWLKWWRGKSP